MFGADDGLFVGRHKVATLFDHLGDSHVPVVALPFIAIDLPFAFDGDAALTRTFGHRHGHVGGVNVAVGRVIDRALQVFGADQRPAFLDLVGCHPFKRNANRFCRRRIDHVFVHTFLRLGHPQVANDEKARVQAGFFLKRFVELDRVVVDVGRRVGHVEIRQKPRRVPCRA